MEFLVFQKNFRNPIDCGFEQQREINEFVKMGGLSRGRCVRQCKKEKWERGKRGRIIECFAGSKYCGPFPFPLFPFLLCLHRDSDCP
jgi:hypothetical protein